MIPEQLIVESRDPREKTQGQSSPVSNTRCSTWSFLLPSSELSSRLVQVVNLAAAISFSIHFPIKGFIKSTKCRQFKRSQIFASSFPSFGRGFDSHRPLQTFSKQISYRIDGNRVLSRPLVWSS
jgi:hypothetical protein